MLFYYPYSFGKARPQEMVANVYRCLVPILNNDDGTVITPLLNTGDQVSIKGYVIGINKSI